MSFLSENNLSKQIELENFYEMQNSSDSIKYKNIYQNSLDFSNLSNIEKSDFASKFHFLCKKCGNVPILKIIKKDKIKYICKCKESPRELLIKDIFQYLFNYEDNKTLDNLECHFHPNEKYIYYCNKCKSNLCYKCAMNCQEHKNNLINLLLDKNTNNKAKYIIEKINEKEKIYKNFKTEDDNIDTSDINTFEFNNNISKKQINNEINTSLENKNIKFIEKLNNNDKINIEKENDEIYNIILDEKNYEENFLLISLFSIVIYDFLNYPNFNHLETISNLEKLAIYYFNDYNNEINLIYKFEKDNIKDNSIELFGEIFINNNKEICILIINERIFELCRFINLSDIYDNLIIIEYPIKLEVKLIERKNKKITNLSFMFYNILSLNSESNFNNFNSINITKMNYMFYNCYSAKNLPDISNLNTENVNDMSNMFYNCSSLTNLSDISKWNTKNVVDMSYMFYCCESLSSIPDISIWNTNNLKYMNCMFQNCKSLSNLFDSKKWKINKDTETNNIFEGCTLLEKNNINNNILEKNLMRITDIFVFKILKYSLIVIIFGIFFLYYCCNILYCFKLIYIPFNLDKTKEFINDPITYLDLNDTIEFKEDENYFIKYGLNFTYINNGKNFESTEKNFQIFSLLHIIFYIPIIILTQSPIPNPPIPNPQSPF